MADDSEREKKYRDNNNSSKKPLYTISSWDEVHPTTSTIRRLPRENAEHKPRPKTVYFADNPEYFVLNRRSNEKVFDCKKKPQTNNDRPTSVPPDFYKIVKVETESSESPRNRYRSILKNNDVTERKQRRDVPRMGSNWINIKSFQTPMVKTVIKHKVEYEAEGEPPAFSFFLSCFFTLKLFFHLLSAENREDEKKKETGRNLLLTPV